LEPLKEKENTQLLCQETKTIAASHLLWTLLSTDGHSISSDLKDIIGISMILIN